MATDVPAVKAKIVEERAKVAEIVALIDLSAEQTLFDQGKATIDAAQLIFDKKIQRWELVNSKIARLAELDAEILLFTP
jgi:hypothetical protein